MTAVTDILLWLHLMGVAMGVGVGIAVGQIAPRVMAAPRGQRGELWPIEKALGRVIAAGLTLLIVTGPLMLWLKFGGAIGLGWSFWLKMVFVALTVVCVRLTQWANARFDRGDESTAKLISISGPLSGISAILAMVFAVVTFS
jgi:hypothetical protein